MVHVLVVDDDPVALTVVARLAHGITDARVHTAANVDEAVVRLGEEPRIDVLVTDIEMPGRDGIELARWCGEHRPEVRIVTMSSSRFRVDAARELGLSSVQKPIAVGALRQALLQLV